jgi:hypothetical protein
MTFKPFVLSLVGLTIVQLSPVVFALELDGSDVRRELREREERINKLTTEEQLKLRAAEQKAAEDPTVKAALEKRNNAVREFRAALRASMIKADPAVQPILDRVAISSNRGPKQPQLVPSY